MHWAAPDTRLTPMPVKRAALALGLVAFFATCVLVGQSGAPLTTTVVTARATTTTLAPAPPTTVTTATTLAPAPPRASRSATKPRLAPKPPPVAVSDLQPLFWRLLRGCESDDGRSSASGKYHGYFQFSMSSWRKAGGTGMPMDHPYEYQVERAIYWASITTPSKQWPICWNRAMRQYQAMQAAA